jgi:hypothetical protein
LGWIALVFSLKKIIQAHLMEPIKAPFDSGKSQDGRLLNLVDEGPLASINIDKKKCLRGWGWRGFRILLGTISVIFVGCSYIYITLLRTNLSVLPDTIHVGFEHGEVQVRVTALSTYLLFSCIAIQHHLLLNIPMCSVFVE